MINQIYTGTPTSRRFVRMPATLADTVGGTPLLVGALPCVSLDSYQANELGAVCLFGGTFSLTVIGQSAESPQTTHLIKPGDKLYAVGTLDSTTNVTYALTIDANSSNTFFGYLDPTYVNITAGSTDTGAQVLLPAGM